MSKGKCVCCGKQLSLKGLKFRMIVLLVKKPFDFCSKDCRDKWCDDNGIIAHGGLNND